MVLEASNEAGPEQAQGQVTPPSKDQTPGDASPSPPAEDKSAHGKDGGNPPAPGQTSEKDTSETNTKSQTPTIENDPAVKIDDSPEATVSSHSQDHSYR